MKSNEITRSVEKSEGLVEKQFSINESAQAFEILSKNIYTDVPLAIVRELSTNAYDAQVEAGNRDVPFDVHLPTASEPYFSIRDYGTGLTDSQIQEIYTTYFSSTRNKSNDYMGCFGLGSKTPFAYTDKFTVTSFRDGTANYYCLYKNEKGVPAITILHSENTSLSNGLLINIPIKQEDCIKFQKAAHKVYEFFNIKPNFIGNQLSWTPREPLFSLEKDYVVKNYKGTMVILGQITYHFDDTKIKNHINRGVIIHLNIGDCSVSASREELHYDAKTIETVQKRINALEQIIVEDYKKEVVTHTNQLDRFFCSKKFHNICGLIPPSRFNLPDGVRVVKTRYNGSITLTSLKDYYYNDTGISTQPILVEEDIPWDAKAKKNFAHYISINNGEFWLIPPTLDKEILGSPSLKLSQIPAAPRKVVESAEIRQYIKRIDNYGSLLSVSTLEEGCYVGKVHSQIVFNGQKISPLDAYNFAKFLGYENVYAISNTRIKSLKGNLVNLEAEAKKYITNWFANATQYEKSVLAYGGVLLDGKVIAALDGLSPESTDLCKMAKVPPINTNVSLMVNRFLIDNSAAVDFKGKFHAKYPLVYSLSPNLIDEMVVYIKAKECLLTAKQA